MNLQSKIFRTNLKKLVQKVERKYLQYRVAKKRVRIERTELNYAKQAVDDAIAAQKILQSVAAETQKRAHEQITRIVTRAIQFVFGAGYQFRINFERKRGKTHAKMVIVRRGHEIDPLESESGGIVDVAAMALRLSCLSLATPKRRKLVVLDEPLKNVHGVEYQRRTVQLIESLSEELGFQIIIVTGLEWLRLGKVIHV